MGIGVVDAVNIGTQVRNISLSVRTTDNICTAMVLLDSWPPKALPTSSVLAFDSLAKLSPRHCLVVR